MNATRARKIRTFAVIALLFAPALIAPACNNGDVSIGHDKEPIACMSDADCPANVPCLNGLCAASCMSDADCPAPDTCQNGLCLSPNSCQPSAEVCDGIDNDCDGLIDDSAPCPMGKSCQNGVCVAGAGCNADADCAPGEVCFNGVCQPGCQPQPELCDGVDNNCDGMVDNGATCPGGWACQNGACSCQGAPEVCDGFDNDCDSMVDDGAPCPAGKTCQNGMCVMAGACNSNADCPANQVCVNGVCQSNGCQPQPEACDGMDNDCDGVVDDSAPCPQGYACMNGACCGMGLCLMACVTDADCNPAQTCQSGFCAP